MKNLFVITGANGAGKSTLSHYLLPTQWKSLSVFDGDKFFVEALKNIFPSQTKSPKYAREEAFKRTITEFESRVSEAIHKQKDFAYEGHFSSDVPWDTIKKFKNEGYRVTMFFLMVENLSLSQKRVVERVKTGGHYVTPQEVEKNFIGNLIFLNQYHYLLDELIVADNSYINQPSLLLHHSDKEILYIASQRPQWFEVYLPNLL